MANAKTIITSLAFCLLFSICNSQHTNHAVVIGVDSYGNWSNPAKLKDNIQLAVTALKDSKFNFKVTTAINNEATAANIRQVINNLAVNEGDFVWLYFCGHGAQIDDQNGDEKDGKDEVFVCFDSPKQAHADFAKKSLTDDSLHLILNKLRGRLGKKGQVFMLAECCHSSTLDKGKTVEYKTYSQQWQSAFLSENAKAKGAAPLISFSASRASNMVNTGYDFSTYFFSTFRNFKKGSYYDLFSAFYLTQRQKIFSEADIELTVNLHTEDPAYLQLGFFQDTTYAPRNRIRVTHAHYDYPNRPEIDINHGIFQGITLGTSLAITCVNNHTLNGTVTETRNGAATVTLTGPPADKSLLWTADVSVTNYRFNDTLFYYLDSSVTPELIQTIDEAVKDLKLVKRIKNKSKGYTFAQTETKELVLVRNEDKVALMKLSRDQIRETLIRMQINHFVKNLSAQYDSAVQLSLYRDLFQIPRAPVVFLKKGERINLYAEAKSLPRDKYYAVIHIEDEFIRQLVPVNFQINDSECKFHEQTESKIHLGDIVIGRLPGRLMMITSDTPIDLREILLSPEHLRRKNNGAFNELEQMVNNLFIAKNDQSALYHYASIMKHEISYQVE